MRWMIPLVVVGCLGLGAAGADELEKAACLMMPEHAVLELPESGFVWQPGGDFSGSCEGMAVAEASRGLSGSCELWVVVDGPGGSGRYWAVSIGVSDEPGAPPVRGVCMATSTVGWRTMRTHSGGALPWLEDVDGDGSMEVVVWASFPLHAHASMAEYGLVAWVYRLDAAGSLKVDWEASREMAGKLVDEYRVPMESVGGDRRSKAASALEDFAEGRCRVANEVAP